MLSPKLPTLTESDRQDAEKAFTQGDSAALTLGLKHGRGHRSGTLRCQCQRCSAARHYAYFILKNRRLWPLLKIAAAFGRSDHHQIVHGIQKAAVLYPSLVQGDANAR